MATSCTLGGTLQSRDEVFLAVGAHLADGELRAGDYHGLAEIFEHEAERRGRKGHGVCAVEYHESVELLVVLPDMPRNLLPVSRIDVG